MTESTPVRKTDSANLATALAAFQAELPTIKKGNTAKVQTKTGGNYSYDYADLTDVSEVVLPLLAKHGLAWVTTVVTEGDNICLGWALIHGGSGEAIQGSVPVGRAGANWQDLGGSITYARRYCLTAVTGVAPGGDDNDGKDAQAGGPRQTRQSAPIPQESGELPNDLYRLSSLKSVEDVRAMYRQAQAAGHLGLTVPLPDERGTLIDTPFSEVLAIVAKRLTPEDAVEAAEAAAVAAHEASEAAQ